MTHLVSVIIPTYNGARTIERALKSVLSQSADCQFEILICDDRSTDDTIKIALATCNECKIFVNVEHFGGPNPGRNAGLILATGHVITFLDQDDEWCPDKIKLQLEQINKGYEFVYSSSIKVMEHEG